MQVIKNMLPSNKYNIKAPYTMTPELIVVHNTANDASARNEISYMIRNDNQVSFHYAIDDKEIVQGVPETRNTWNAGDGVNGRGNRKGIAIEICYSKSGGKRFNDAEKLAAKFIAFKLNEKGWSIDRVMKHQDFNGKSCPHRTLQLGWKRFLDMVKAEMGTDLLNNYIVALKDTTLYSTAGYSNSITRTLKKDTIVYTDVKHTQNGLYIALKDKDTKEFLKPSAWTKDLSNFRVATIDDFKTPTSNEDLLECHNTKKELINELDALKQQIKVYKEDINTLETKIDDLEAHNEELKEEIKNIPDMPKFIFKSQRTDNYIIYLPKGIELYIKKD